VPFAERAKGPAVQHDISVAVERMPDFIEQVSPQIEAKFPGTHVVALAIWATATSITMCSPPPAPRRAGT
jgi:hypothetical protein